MMKLDHAKLIRACRLMIALATGTLTSYLLKIPMSGWVMITTCVVLFDQDTVGGTINRGKLRFWATFYGALISLVCIIFFPDNMIIVWSVIGITTFVYAYIYMGTAKSYIGVLGSATLAIILLGNNHHPDLHTAIYRIMDIAIGVIFALLSMLLFFPEYALNRVRSIIIKSLTDISSLIQQVKDERDLEKINRYTQIIELSLLKDVISFNKTIDEAKHEIKAYKNPELLKRYSQCLLQIRRLYRLIIFIFYYELDEKQINNEQVHTVFNQIAIIIKNHSPANRHYDSTSGYQHLNQNIALLEDSGFKRAIQNFSRELQLLTDLISCPQSD